MLSQTVSRHIKHMNSQQPDILAHVAGPFLTIVRPGSGRITTLVLRSLNLMLNCLVTPLADRGRQRTETRRFRERKPQRHHPQANRRLRLPGGRPRSDDGTNPRAVTRANAYLLNCATDRGTRPHDCRQQCPADERRPPQCRPNRAPDRSR